MAVSGAVVGGLVGVVLAVGIGTYILTTLLNELNLTGGLWSIATFLLPVVAIVVLASVIIRVMSF